MTSLRNITIETINTIHYSLGASLSLLKNLKDNI